MNAASVMELKRTSDSRARVLEIAAQLRAAVVDGDDADITGLLEDLLRFKGSNRAQSVALQLRALQSLVYLLRSAAINDELTGLLNRRGFLHCATRLLDLAVRDRCPHRLIYFRLSAGPDGAAFAPMALRQMGNALRDLFPDYGMREALGRLGAAEFAALTPRVEYLACDWMLRHIATTAASLGQAGAGIELGIARFDPQGPVEIDELLARCKDQALRSRELFGRTASSASGPPTRSDASLTVSGRRYASCTE